MPEWTLVIWPFLLGACIGSFLNVVIYRLPRRRSLLGPSRCGTCNARIRFYHNIPIVGWFLVRGRCFDCGAQIPARYPLVETVTAILFAAFGYRDWIYTESFEISGPVIISHMLRLGVICIFVSLVGIANDADNIPRRASIVAVLTAFVSFVWMLWIGP